MAEKIAELVTRNQDSKWEYRGDAKGGSVALPSAWNEVLIECTNTSDNYVTVGTALITYDMASSEIRFINVSNSAQRGNVGFSRQSIVENFLSFNEIKVYVR